jgi:hypothetical protein
MATAQALQSQGSAMGNPMATNGFKGVMGTTGLKTTGPAQQGAQTKLVGTDENLNESRHF